MVFLGGDGGYFYTKHRAGQFSIGNYMSLDRAGEGDLRTRIGVIILRMKGLCRGWVDMLKILACVRDFFLVSGDNLS